MTEQHRERLLQIRNKADASMRTPAGQHVDGGWDSRHDVADDILWMLQLIDIQHQQIAMLTAPETIRRLLCDFTQLTQIRQALVLELMREMKGEHDEQ